MSSSWLFCALGTISIGFLVYVAPVAKTEVRSLSSGHLLTSGYKGQLFSTVVSWGLVKTYHERAQKDQLRRAYVRQMPVLMNMVALGLSAGLSFDASLELYCTRYNNELSKAFNETALSWRIGVASRAEALSDLARTSGVKALERFSASVIEALSFGAPLADVLNHQAELIREDRRSQIEEEIERIPVKMLIPLGTLIVPSMLLAILGPLLSSAMSVA